MLFYEGGCVNCGKIRLTEEEKKIHKIQDTNIYVANDKMGELVLGLCLECMKIESLNFDLAKIKRNMLESEKEASRKKIEILEALELRSVRKRKPL